MDKALRQYIELYDEHRQTIEHQSSPLLNRLRGEAAESLRHQHLPRLGSENYEMTSLPEMLGKDYGININRVAMDVNPAESFKCGVPRLSTALFMMVNDRFALTPVSLNGLPEGVTVGSLNAVGREKGELLSAFYGRLASLRNPVVALNTMLVQDGIVVYVPKGVKVEKPLQIVNIMQSAVPMMVVRRVLIIVEENAEVEILACDHTQNQDVDMMNLQTVEIFAGAGAHVQYYELEESSRRSSRLSALYLQQEASSNVTINGITLYNGKTRNEYHCRFVAEGGTLCLCGMGIEDDERQVDTYSHVEHAAGHCYTDELFKYVVDDRSKGCFTGLVKVDEGASGTEAYQSNRNLVGSDEARMYSKPQLEIYNDDVKCSHGSATGRLDELQLFYMRTRGLDEQEARLLLKQAFLSDVIDKVKMPHLRERLTYLVERRFAGGDASCAGCQSSEGCDATSEILKID